MFPSTFVQDYCIQLEKGSQTHMAGWVRLNGPDKQQKVTVRIPEAGVTQTFDARCERSRPRRLRRAFRPMVAGEPQAL